MPQEHMLARVAMPESGVGLAGFALQLRASMFSHVFSISSFSEIRGAPGIRGALGVEPGSAALQAVGLTSWAGQARGLAPSPTRKKNM